MSRAHTTKIIFDDGDYFTAMLDDGGIRIGLKGFNCYDIPSGHAWFARVAEATTRVEIESYHDDLFAAIDG